MRKVSHRAWVPCVWNSEQFSLCWKRSRFTHLHAVWSFNTVLQWHRWTNINGFLRLRWYGNSKSYILDIGVLGYHVYHRYTFKQLKETNYPKQPVGNIKVHWIRGPFLKSPDTSRAHFGDIIL